MPDETSGSLLVATDLTEACNVVVRAAGALARQIDADLHVVHVVERRATDLATGDAAKGQRQEARRELDRQLADNLPDGSEIASRSVVVGPVAESIEARAEELDSDLLILGPHGRTTFGGQLLGSTADRLLRTSRIPCLVIHGDLHLPARRIGVPVDFSEPSRDALRLAFEWAPGWIAGRKEEDPPVRVVHVGWPVTKIDVPDYEETTLRPQLSAEIERAAAATQAEIGAEAEVLWSNLPAERVSSWVESREIDLLVLGTLGRSGLARAVLGRMATRLAREAPCSVLLVPPPHSWVERKTTAPALHRVVVGTDFSRGAIQAGSWIAEHFAPEAELILTHGVDVPYPPPFLRHGLPPRKELAATAVRGAEQRLEQTARQLPRAPRQLVLREGRGADVLVETVREFGADLVAVGGFGRREGLWANLGSTAESLLATSPVPVLVVRSVDTGPPSHLLVPLDGSDDARKALAWAVLLAKRSDARITLLHVVSSGLMGAMRRVSSESSSREIQDRVQTEVRRWLDDVASEIGLPGDRVATLVEEGVPGLQILASAARLGCDLVVIGSRGSGGARALGLGSVASSLVRNGSMPVLVVPPPRP